VFWDGKGGQGADAAHSWTAITWASVVGSSLLMFVWIIIYSFFQSSDFINEVTVLFGGMTFWATIVLAVALALRASPPSPCPVRS
jgi:hypothetical protein